ncbi:XapX domain-containing protein [Yokenella regensburgei]|uniref:DUF1427 family protein n=1 Tax=Yokenella regensburgei TaxID=158877 RepID=UPI003F16AE69
MSTELISLGAGVLIGLLYAVLKVRSPAPPAIALVGLLGMLAGEHLIAAVITQDAPSAAISQPQVIPSHADNASAISRYTEAG